MHNSVLFLLINQNKCLHCCHIIVKIELVQKELCQQIDNNSKQINKNLVAYLLSHRLFYFIYLDNDTTIACFMTSTSISKHQICLAQDAATTR